MGHIARVCGSKTVVVTQQQPDESAVVPISQVVKTSVGRHSSNVSDFTPYSDAEEVTRDD